MFQTFSSCRNFSEILIATFKISDCKPITAGKNALELTPGE